MKKYLCIQSQGVDPSVALAEEGVAKAKLVKDLEVIAGRIRSLVLQIIYLQISIEFVNV